MRSYAGTADAWMQNVIKPLNADVFISTWDTMGWRVKSKAPDKHCDGAIIDSKKIDREDVSRKFGGTPHIRIETYPLHEPRFKKIADPLYEARDKYDLRHCDQPKANVSMYYKIYTANRMKILAEEEMEDKYDIVIRSRPDIHIGGIPDKCLEAPEILWCPSTAPGNLVGETNDLVFISGSENIDWVSGVYGRFGIMIKRAAREGKEEVNRLIQPHLMWTSVIEEGDIQQERIDLGALVNAP